MTLILVLGNRDQVIQISDRRTTVGDIIVDGEENKSTIMTCADGRYAIGFAGVATLGQFYVSTRSFDRRLPIFETQVWILESLDACGPPDFTLDGILQRMRDKASRDFRSHPLLRERAPKDKRLSIIVTGFLDRYRPPRCMWALITNFQDVQRDSIGAWGEFQLTTFYESHYLEQTSFVERIGCWHAWKAGDELLLRQLLTENKPAEVLTYRGCDVVRDIARRPQAQNTIGTNLTSIRLPRHDDGNLNYVYDPGLPTNVLVAPDFALLGTHGVLIKGFAVEKDPTAGPHPERPMLVSRMRLNQTRVRPDQICPCGSGKRFKSCHGVRGGWDRHP